MLNSKTIPFTKKVRGVKGGFFDHFIVAIFEGVVHSLFLIHGTHSAMDGDLPLGYFLPS